MTDVQAMDTRADIDSRTGYSPEPRLTPKRYFMVRGS